MHIRLSLLICLCASIGCVDIGTITPLFDQGADGGVCPKPPDLAPVPAKCAAAKGLSGDNLLCVDFSTITGQPLALDTPPPTQLPGWDFVTNCGGKNWQVANNLLQIKMFSGFSGSCALTLPQTTASQIQQYSRLTLSIQHRIDLNDPEQQARVFLNDDTDAKNVLWQDTAVRNVSRQQTVITIDSADLPVLLKTGFKWFLKISSTGTFGRNGWQIESVAVQGER